MQDLEFISLFIDPLEQNNVPYMVFGSVASILYGEPRSTSDIDLGIYLPRERLALLPDLYPADEFYVPPLDVLIIETGRQARGHYNIIHHQMGFKADFYPSRNHPYLGWAVKNIQQLEIGASKIKLAPPEYVIMGKLDFYREGRSTKHLSDIAGILAVRKDEIDFELLETAVKELGLQNEWEVVVNF